MDNAYRLLISPVCFLKGNLIAVGQKRSIKRWVAPTLKVLRSRFEKMPDHLRPGLQKRSEFVEWNYRAELFAFGKRLNEPFSLSLLQTAFTQNSYVARERLKQEKLGIENAELEMNDNEELAKHGQHIANEYIIKFIEKSFPLLLTEGQVAIRNYLLSEETLAYVASNLGMLDLLLDVDYPPSTESFARSLLAVIGALEKSTGDLERTQCFIQDFICTQLNQKDIMEIWIIDDPETLLRNLCRERKIAEPEARLLGDCGRNTVLAAYYVGLYSNKKLIGKGLWNLL